MLAALLGHALVEAGFAVETGPGDPVVLVRGASRLEPFAIVEAMAKGNLTEAVWRETCAKHGIGDRVLAG
jgi:hypothetical protein